MAKKSTLPLRVAPLQHVVAVPITDPDEQAALDKMRKRSKRKQGNGQPRTNRKGAGR